MVIPRYDTNHYIKDSYKDKRLLKIGKLKMTHLGKFLQTRYIIRHKLIRKYYDRREIYVRTMDQDSKIESCNFILHSLYTNCTIKEKWTPIPVHMTARRRDYLLNNLKSCDSVHELKNLKSSVTKELFNNKELVSFFGYIRYHTKSMHDSSDLYRLYKKLTLMKLTGSALPPWAIRNYNKTHSFYDVLNKLSKIFYNKRSERLHKNNIAGGYLVNHIIKDFDDFIKEKTSIKLSIYVTNLSTLSSVANMFRSKWPPSFNGNIAFELLREIKNSHWISKKYYVRIIYQNYGRRKYLLPMENPWSKFQSYEH
ncbi:hypothetical protein A3Q56_06597 [Intoshia linei]|uniref:Uncharacterized protein n=1 Tax=Intoshia linei TaxID=1819745 RepID=A0A177AUL6_9BILA|nr:hypothetical protein A3Q56_06597 [Intoshia linei]